MAAGRPVVASATGGTPFLVGDAGILFHSEDPDDLARALTRMLSDGDLANALGRKARERVLNDFDENVYVRRFAEMVEMTTGARAGSATVEA